MPREHYAITLTFMPHIKYSVRMERIKEFPRIIREHLKLYHSYRLAYSIEYHKYPPGHPFMGKPNPMAPYVHALLQVEEELSQRHINAIFTKCKKRFGRT